VLPFVVAMGLTTVAVAAVWATPETARQAAGRWRIQRPDVPPEIRRDFARIALTGTSVWTVAALFLSVVPSYAGDLLDTRNLALLGAISALMLGCSCAAQAPVRTSMSLRTAQRAGLVLVIAGVAALVLAFPAGSLPLVLGAAVLAGTGHGMGFYGAQGEMNLIAPVDRRGETTAAFYTCIYLGVATAVIGVGLLSVHTSLRTAVTVFGAVVTVACALAAVWQLRAPALAETSQPG
jgi:sugar phosphate permease